MKRFIRFIAASFIAIAATSCYDDTALVNDLEEMKNKYSELSEEIDLIHNLLSATEKGDFITSVEETSEGYIITLASGETINIRHGKDGVDGKDGENGKDGADGKDGENGKDGSNASCQFKDIIITEDSITFILSDGQEFVIPIVKPLDITFDIPDESLYIPYSTVTIGYTITGGGPENRIGISSSSYCTARIEEKDAYSGTITISDQNRDFDIIVHVTDGVSRSIFRVIRFVAGVCFPNVSYTNYVPASESTLEIPILANIEYSVKIPGCDWITVAPESKAYEVREETITLNITENTSTESRSAQVEFWYEENFWCSFEIVQTGREGIHLTQLFNIDPYETLGVPNYYTSVYSSLASIDGYLILNHGDGSAPIYADGKTGEKLGEIETGGKIYGAITNDEGGNMLLCNHLDGSGMFEIYRTSSVTEAPELWYSYHSDAGLPMGAKIKVCGNIDTDATIVVCYEGIDGITMTGSFLQIIVKNGAIVSATVHDTGLAWGSAPTGSAGLVPTNAAGDNGWFYSSYNLQGMVWLKSNYDYRNSLSTNSETGWLLNYNSLDCKRFNNANYLAFFTSHHFPAWEGTPGLWIFDVTEPSLVSGDSYENSESLVASDSRIEYYNHNNNSSNDTVSSSDVVMAISEDGTTIYIYCYDHYANVLCGYSSN